MLRGWREWLTTERQQARQEASRQSAPPRWRASPEPHMASDTLAWPSDWLVCHEQLQKVSGQEREVLGPAGRARTPQMDGAPAEPQTASTTAATSRWPRSRPSWAQYGWWRNSMFCLRIRVWG